MKVLLVLSVNISLISLKSFLGEQTQIPPRPSQLTTEMESACTTYGHTIQNSFEHSAKNYPGSQCATSD